jgi:hypothetical protein
MYYSLILISIHSIIKKLDYYIKLSTILIINSFIIINYLFILII